MNHNTLNLFFSGLGGGIDMVTMATVPPLRGFSLELSRTFGHIPQPYVDIFVIRDYNYEASTSSININKILSFKGLINYKSALLGIYMI